MELSLLHSPKEERNANIGLILYSLSHIFSYTSPSKRDDYKVSFNVDGMFFKMIWGSFCFILWFRLHSAVFTSGYVLRDHYYIYLGDHLQHLGLNSEQSHAHCTCSSPPPTSPHLGDFVVLY